jgi:hypothetical protein
MQSITADASSQSVCLSLCYSGRQLQKLLLDGDVVKCQQKLHRNGASKDAN